MPSKDMVQWGGLPPALQRVLGEPDAKRLRAFEVTAIALNPSWDGPYLMRFQGEDLGAMSAAQVRVLLGALDLASGFAELEEIEIAREGMAFIRKAEAAIAKAEGRS